MFIMLVGLVSVAALLPVGNLQVLQGAKLSHGTALGRAGFRELKVRGMLKPESQNNAGGTIYQWGYPDPSSGNVTNLQTTSGLLPVGQAYALDPLVIAVAVNSGNVADAKNAAYFPVATGFSGVSPAPPVMTRVTFMSTATSAAWTRELAEDVFVSHDDIAFLPGASAKDAPYQQFTPIFPATAEKRSADGNYSWIATVAPTTLDPTAPYVASVVVFYKRPPSLTVIGSKPPRERVLTTTFNGGGDVTLSTTHSTDWLNMKAGEWIMLGKKIIFSKSQPGASPPINNPANPDTNNDHELNIFKWCRIVALDDVVGSSRNVTLSGGDWDPSTNIPPNYVISISATYAYIFDGAIGVYEKSIKIER